VSLLKFARPARGDCYAAIPGLAVASDYVMQRRPAVLVCTELPSLRALYRARAAVGHQRSVLRLARSDEGSQSEEDHTAC
jgi:hypothetical protein